MLSGGMRAIPNLNGDKCDRYKSAQKAYQKSSSGRWVGATHSLPSFPLSKELL